MKYLAVSLLFLFCSSTWGAGLLTPNSIGTTAVLPKGVKSAQVGGLVTTVGGWYNDYGVTTGVAEPFNQELSYGRLLKSESDENIKLNVESQLQLKNVSLDEIAGTSYADINTRVIATVPTFAYGLTDNWTLAVAVPIVYTYMDVATGFVGTEQLQKMVTDFSKKSRKQTKMIQEKLNDVIATELSSKGYKPLQDEEKTSVGDLVLVAKYMAHKNTYYSWALTNTFALPTSHVRDVNKVVDPTPGDGQFDWGIASTLEFPLHAQVRLISNTSYTFQFADTRETRIPHSVGERLSSDIDYDARRDLGDQMFTSLALSYTPLELLSFGGSWTLAYKQRDKWTGTEFSAERYRVLGHESEQYMQAVYFQTGISTLKHFQRKKFPIPLLATLGVGKVVEGRNVRHDPLWSMNMTMFF